MAISELKDPTTRYPKPPYKKQSQPWPGLAGKMEPRPDHGETSYKGSGRLAGRKALITGGDSGMGRAAAIAFAREGADVAINYFPNEEPDAQEVIALIKAEKRLGLAIPGDIRDENDWEEPPIVAEANTRFWVSGRVTLDELSEALGEHFEDKDITTVGGLIFQRLGRVPRAGETLTLHGFRVVVERVVRRRIDRLYFERLETANAVSSR